MLFNSIEFAVFFAVVFLIYFRLPSRGRPLFLLLASYFFYAFWRWEYTTLLIFSTFLDYSAARLIGRTNRPSIRKLLLLASIVGNLGILFFFKYLVFILHTVENIAGLIGLNMKFPPLSEALPWYTLPIGISFFTFQTMSYTIDVYRGKMKPTKNILHVALYVCYFPQLIAGPIMRGHELLPQIGSKKDSDFSRIQSGLLLCFWGLFKKVCLADNLATFVDPVYASPESFSSLALIMATYAFAFQIYCDFSGYSDIAIGLARILGFDLIINFNRPYLAASIEDFWRRWHISLSRWLRDYLYIPLGGNRCSKIRMYFNLMVTMLLGGLWHGANWTFVVWGGLHGLALAINKIFKGRSVKLPEMLTPLRMVITFNFVCFTWIFFRAPDIGTAFRIISRIFMFRNGAGIDVVIPCLIFAFIMVVHIFQEKGVNFTKRFQTMLKLPNYVLSSFFYTAMFLILIIFSKGQTEFVYFQF